MIPYLAVEDAAPLLLACTGRHGGVSRGAYCSANMAWHVGDQEEAVVANRGRLRQQLGGGSRFTGLVTVSQVHGDRVVIVDPRRESEPDAWRHQKADGLITREPGWLLGILTADCFPVFLAAGGNAGVGVVHAGWRGVVRGIVPRAIVDLASFTGTRPEDMRLYIGPGIRRCCFAVGAEVPAAIEHAWPGLNMAAIWFPGPRPGYGRVDLPALIACQAAQAGIPVGRIFDCGICTAGGDFFFSYRRDHGITGRQIGVIGLPAG
jgi:hypothetical protein